MGLMSQAVTCPSRQQLENFLSDSLAPGEAQSVEQHLIQCQQCIDTLSRMHDGTFQELVRANAAAKSATRSDPDFVQGLIKKLKESLPAVSIADRPTIDGSFASSMSDPPMSAGDDAELSEILAPAEQPDELGRLGQYRVLKVLGAGGMGMVLQAEDPGLERMVALKVMKPELARKKEAHDRFLREARATAKLKNDHVITIHQVGEDRGVPFIAMEFLDGKPLDEFLKGGKRLNPRQIIRLGREMAEGLAAAHEQDLIHRDIKPGNIWLEAPKGRVKILDFGLARSISDDVSLTQTGAILGTPAYMAPEQARAEKVDHRCDLFSLGAVLYRLATGELPFKGATTIAILTALAVDNPTPVREINSAIPEKLADLVMRLLEKEPDNRPQSAKAVVKEIQQIEREPIEAAGTKELPPSSTKQVKAAKTKGPIDPVSVGKTRPEPAKSRAWIAIAAIAAVAVIGVGVWLALTVFSFKTDKGTFLVELKGDDVEALATGKTLIIRDKKSKREYKLTIAEAEKGKKLPPGDYVLRLTDGTGLVVETKEFTLKRGEKVNVRVTVKPPKVAVPEPTPKSQWTQLFNGKDLTGWTVKRGGRWRVVNGALTGEGRQSYLVTERDDFDDFHLRAEVKLNDDANSGLYFRVGEPLSISNDYEVQLTTNGQWQYQTGSLYGDAKADKRPDIKPDKWFKVEIIAAGKHIRILIDGEETLDYRESRPNRNAKGRIALQHQNQKTKVFFRKIEIRNIKKGKLTPTPHSSSTPRDPKPGDL